MPLLNFITINILFIVYHVNSIETISSSCNDKERDGLYYIKPTPNGEIIPVICNNGYTMLDASLNFDIIESYFTSMYRYGNDDKIMYGTDCSDSSGWRDWYIPAKDDTKFRVARNCQECTSGDIYGDNTGYYMTSGYFCPVDVDSLGCVAHNDALVEDPMCQICDDEDGICGVGSGRDGIVTGNWCDCYTLQLSGDHLTPNLHAEYCEGMLSPHSQSINLIHSRSLGYLSSLDADSVHK